MNRHKPRNRKKLAFHLLTNLLFDLLKEVSLASEGGGGGGGGSWNLRGKI